MQKNIIKKPMSSQEKAEELFNKYFSEIRMPTDCEGCMQCVGRCGNMVAIAKKYALITVEEILDNGGTLYVIEYPPKTFSNGTKYWQEVKQELLKL